MRVQKPLDVVREGFLSILFVRFGGWHPPHKKLLKNFPFNSLCEIPARATAQNTSSCVPSLSILFVRFLGEWADCCKALRLLSILFVRFLGKLSPTALVHQRFQFSLWDSAIDRVSDSQLNLQTFNSLCEILWILYRFMNRLKKQLSILFVRFLRKRCLFAHAAVLIFQFSLWDSPMPERVKADFQETSFNSLCEIHITIGSLAYFGKDHFQFSLWDSKNFFTGVSQAIGTLSILFVRFLLRRRGCLWKLKKAFNSLCEILYPFLLKFLLRKWTFNSLCEIP